MRSTNWKKIREDNPPTESYGYSDHEDDSANEFEVDEEDEEDVWDQDDDEEVDEAEEEEEEGDGGATAAGGGGFNVAAYRQFK